MGRCLKDIHIGSAIAQQIACAGMSYAEFARRLNCDRTTVYGIVKSKSIDIERLIRISEILDFDFIEQVYRHTTVGKKLGTKSVTIKLSPDDLQRLQENGSLVLKITLDTHAG